MTSLEIIHAEHQVPKRTFEEIPVIGVTTVALELRPKLNYEEWEQAGKELGKLGRGTQWWLGDWLLYGERAYGEEFAQAVEGTGLAIKTLQNYMWVAENVPPTIRRTDLSWQHHLLVAGLEDSAEKRLWLARAANEGWSTDKMRRTMKGQGLIRSYSSHQSVETCGQCGRTVKIKEEEEENDD